MNFLLNVPRRSVWDSGGGRRQPSSAVAQLFRFAADEVTHPEELLLFTNASIRSNMNRHLLITFALSFFLEQMICMGANMLNCMT